MKKAILYGALGLVAVVVAAAAAAPMLIGNGVRDATMNGMLELLPPESRNQFRITETRFDSGWFSSEGELDLRYAPLAAEEDLALRLIFKISHGPLLFTPDGIRLGLAYAEIVPSFNSAELAQAMAALPIELPDVRVDLFADLDQSLRLGLSMEPFNFSDASGQVTFAGMEGSLMANADLSGEMQFSMGELRAEQPATQMGFTLAGLELESRSQMMNDLLAPGSAMLTIPAISSGAPLPFSVSNISIDSRIQASSAGPAQIDIHQRFGVGAIESDLPVASANWTMELNEVRSDLVRSYYGMIAEVQAAMNGNTTAATDPLEAYAEEFGTTLIQNSLVFKNLVEANVFDGDHSIDMHIDWRGMPGVTDVDGIEPMDILEIFSFTFAVSLDEAAIMRSPLAEMVDPYVQLGYLRLDGGRILMDASLRDAELTVNDETVPLQQFL